MANPDRRPLRVIQWSTGNAGRNAVRGIVRHPDLELVGLHAHAPEKQGVDAAELCGLATPTGVRATNDVDALLALDADCVCYMAQGETRIRETIDDLTRILRSGKNVVNTSLVSLVLPGVLARSCATRSRRRARRAAPPSSPRASTRAGRAT